MIIPGMVSATFREKSADDIIRLCKEADLQAVEWSENAHVMPGDPEGAAELLKKTQMAGLTVAAYGSYYRLGQNEDPKTVFQASLVSAKALKAPLIRVWAGTKPSLEVSEEEARALANEAAVIGEMAAAEGIKIAFEWHKNTLTDTNESAMNLLNLADQDNLYCLWQPTVALSMEERCEGLRLLRERNRLLNLHIYYWPNGTRRPLSEGMDVWKTYLSHVNQQQDRFGLLEFVMGNTEAQFLEDAQILKNLLKQ